MHHNLQIFQIFLKLVIFLDFFGLSCYVAKLKVGILKGRKRRMDHNPGTQLLRTIVAKRL